MRALQEDGRVNTAATRMLPSVDPRPGAVGDHELLVRLRAREESAFVTLIDSYGSVPLRIAMAYVPTRAVAEEVVQETWLGVLDGIDRFEGRSSLKHWVFRILTNTAKTRAIESDGARRSRRWRRATARIGRRTRPHGGRSDRRPTRRPRKAC